MIKTNNSFLLSWLIHQRRQDTDVNQSYTPWLQAFTKLLILKARQTTPQVQVFIGSPTFF